MMVKAFRDPFINGGGVAERTNRRTNPNYSMMMTGWANYQCQVAFFFSLTWIHKNGHISLNYGPIFKFQNLACSGLRRRSDGRQ